ncbi:hypothetical protein S40285_02069 [Stachybotrys chlorohalonatus IBT 40285]|uniref:Integral membrane protein n=1 Tax=Stachybotrys chlorohalonatus (strain IBT 40285) TaxID=1283841 RepID=A0A084R1E3_STAC4|nr:hypothetical protein S40285_02069 [Stachybotrys chlorohalonata IBT 40285]
MPWRLNPPDEYRSPQFPALNVRTLYDLTEERRYTLYYISDVVRFTVEWTLITYGIFHLGAVCIAMATHGWNRSSWKYVWAVPVVYLVTAAVEALVAGSITGAVVGAVYQAGYYEMNTWIPLVWGLISVLILIVSSFTIQGGL